MFPAFWWGITGCWFWAMLPWSLWGWKCVWWDWNCVWLISELAWVNCHCTWGFDQSYQCFMFTEHFQKIVQASVILVQKIALSRIYCLIAVSMHICRLHLLWSLQLSCMRPYRQWLWNHYRKGSWLFTRRLTTSRSCWTIKLWKHKSWRRCWLRRRRRDLLRRWWTPWVPS